MIRRPPRSTRTDTLFPYTTLFRSGRILADADFLEIRRQHDLGRLRQVAFQLAPPAHQAGQQDGIADQHGGQQDAETRSEEHTSELQSLMRISYAVFCLKKTTHNTINTIFTPSPESTTTRLHK